MKNTNLGNKVFTLSVYCGLWALATFASGCALESIMGRASDKTVLLVGTAIWGAGVLAYHTLRAKCATSRA